MRIGIVPVLSPSHGGVYQYSLTMLHAIDKWRTNGCEDEFIVFYQDVPHPIVMLLNDRGWTAKPIRPPTAKEVPSKPRDSDAVRSWWQPGRNLSNSEKRPIDPEVVRFRPEMTHWFHRCGVHLMLFPYPDPLSFETRFPYVMAIHDLQHRLQPEFPEVSAGGESEWREYYFRNGSCYATLLLADSEVGKEDILNLYGPYGVTPDRVKVLPYLPSSYLGTSVSEEDQKRVRATHQLPEHYLFYPAHFWPHKNHVRIVQALGLLREESNLRIPIVFCGSYTGEIREQTFHEVMAICSQLGLQEQIHYIGWVPDEDMSAIYAGAVALIMPTFFGPTNIPILEAWALGCPVLTSDIRGIREQAGNAAFLVDPRSVESIADGIFRLWMDENLQFTLIHLGRQRLACYTPDDYLRRFKAILEDAKTRVRSQKLASAD